MPGLVAQGPAHKPAVDPGAKLDCLQVLRGLAAVMVVLYHSGTLFAVHTGQLLWGNVFRAGFSGVEVFFVLSGLVIYWVHGPDIGQPAKARSFLLRRGFRLLPVYWVVVVLKALKEPGAVALSTLVTAVLLLPAYPPFINVSWTLSYELLFYGLFLLWIVLPRGRWSLLPVVLLLLPALLSVAWPALVPVPGAPPGMSSATALQDWARFLFNPHLLGFAYGVAVGWLLRRFGPASPGASAVLVGVGLLAFVIAAAAGTHLSNLNAALPGRTAYDLAELQSNGVFDAGVLVFGVPAALVVGGLMSLELRGRLKIPFLQPLRWVGDVSYSLYLTHGFVIHLCLGRAGFRSIAAAHPAVLVLVWCATLLVAWLFYRAVEVPALTLGRRLSSKRPTPALRD